MKRILTQVSRSSSSSFLWLGLGSLLWLVVRSGTRPSRLRYPCQQAAAATGTFWLSAFLAPGVLRGLSASTYVVRLQSGAGSAVPELVVQH